MAASPPAASSRSTSASKPRHGWGGPTRSRASPASELAALGLGARPEAGTDLRARLARTRARCWAALPHETVQRAGPSGGGPRSLRLSSHARTRARCWAASPAKGFDRLGPVPGGSSLNERAPCLTQPKLGSYPGEGDSRQREGPDIGARRDHLGRSEHPREALSRASQIRVRAAVVIAVGCAAAAVVAFVVMFMATEIARSEEEIEQLVYRLGRYVDDRFEELDLSD